MWAEIAVRPGLENGAQETNGIYRNLLDGLRLYREYPG